MTRRLVPLLCRLATRLMPPACKPWGAAMEAELCFIDDSRAAVSYAAGCLIAALQERARDFDARLAAGLWSIALVSTAFALFHLQCGARGVQVLLGRPDGFLDSVVRSGRADAAFIDSYRSAMPVVIVCLFCLGIAHLAAAYFLVRQELRKFLLAWCMALISAAAAVSIQLSIVWSGDIPSEFFALLFQAATLPLLMFWSDLHRRRESKS